MSQTAEIRALARTNGAAAEARLSEWIAGLFGIPVSGLRINHDQYSLNSLHGFFRSGAEDFFFKFHQEEGEEAMRGEYYRADILARAGLPVDQPVHMSTLPGEQVLIYRRRTSPRFSDVLRALDLAPEPEAIARAAAAEAALNDRILAVARQTLHPITPAQSRAEPIHRLFHERLIDPPQGRYPGGRLAAFYVGQRFELPGLSADWAEIASAQPVLNGIPYRHSLGELFGRAHARLDPARLADAGGIVAHGDAHNANVWYDDGELSYFDPAFAGADVPALLAEVKPTFHNIFAHPLWLYDAAEAAGRYQASARLEAGRLYIDTDWAPGPVRHALLAAKAAHFWRPWIAHLAAQNLLPPDWEEVLRLALFLCPTLVMNLRGGNPVSLAVGLQVALMCGSAPEAGADLVTDFLAGIRSGLRAME